MFPTRLLTFFGSLQAILLLTALTGAQEPRKEIHEKAAVLDIKIINPDGKMPEFPWNLTLRRDGSLSSLGEGAFTNEQLRKVIQRDAKPGKPFAICLSIHSPKTVSIHLLGASLERIRRLADPGSIIVVYIPLHNLKRETEEGSKERKKGEKEEDERKKTEKGPKKTAMQ